MKQSDTFVKVIIQINKIYVNIPFVFNLRCVFVKLTLICNGDIKSGVAFQVGIFNSNHLNTFLANHDLTNGI